MTATKLPIVQATHSIRYFTVTGIFYSTLTVNNFLVTKEGSKHGVIRVLDDHIILTAKLTDKGFLPNQTQNFK